MCLAAPIDTSIQHVGGWKHYYQEQGRQGRIHMNKDRRVEPHEQGREGRTRPSVQASGDLAKLACIVRHCGSCMVGLSAMVGSADATLAVPLYSEPMTDTNITDAFFFWKVVGTMVAVWNAIVVMTTCWCAARLGPLHPTRQRQRNRR